MKYFIRRPWHTRPDITWEFSEKDTEVTAKRARELYKDEAGPGFINLSAVPNFIKGKEVRDGGFVLWGEDITDKECFKRRLAGQLAQDIIE